jgi:histo-blood group ABO system transferase
MSPKIAESTDRVKINHSFNCGTEPKDVLYVIGRPGERAEIVGDTLFLDCPDSDEYRSRKAFALWRYVRNHLDFDRVFKCDDDTFVNVAALESAHCPADFFGYVHSTTTREGGQAYKGRRSEGANGGPWADGGLGYFLSRRAVSVLADFHDAEALGMGMFEDRAVSDALRLSGIVPARLPGQKGDDLLQRAIEGWAFSAHSVPPGAMSVAYAKMRASTTERVVTFKKLGANGRLGNQLWQIASTLGMASYFRAKVSFNADWGSREMFSVPDDFFVDRHGCEAQAFPFRLPPGQAIWMQDWWNWWAIEPQIRRFFSPRPHVTEQIQQAYAGILAIPESRRLAVHVRRGDYVGNQQNYVSLSPNYYREAIGRFPNMTPIVFSDDPHWCRQNIPNAVVAPNAARPEEHLFLMSLCRRHVIANSTFSYWGAVLADSEEVVYPSPWFGPHLGHINLDWSIPPSWTPLSSTSDSRRLRPHAASTPMNIALCLIATGKYYSFLAPCIASVRRHFCLGDAVQIHAFSEEEFQGPGITWWKAPHRPWPGPTLYRYHTMLTARAELLKADYVFYLDVDSVFAAAVGSEICGELTATLHPGFSGKPRSSYTYENRPESQAGVLPHEGTHYYCGAFQGGRAANWIAAMEEMASRIDEDAQRGITALWHDESHWNRYLIDHPPEVILPPTYCCPESCLMQGRKLLALDKNHEAIRV